jgi:methyl-branched lipid omega-hydroxylase
LSEPATTLAVDEINPGSFDFWLRDDTHGAMAKLRKERPIAWHQHPDSGKGFWSVTRYDDIAAVTQDWETFSSAFGMQVRTDVAAAASLEKVRSMIVTDPPKHTRLRTLVNRRFSPKMMGKVESSVRERARNIVDAIAPKGHVDFVAEVASVLPLAIICDLMGIPAADRGRVMELTSRHLGGGDPDFGGTMRSIQEAGEALRDYGLWLARQRLAHPEDDLTTALVHAEVDGAPMPPEDLGPFFLLLAAAGNDTTRAALSHGICALTDCPEQKQRWLTDLEGYGPTAADEIVRWASPVLHMRRTLTRDATWKGFDMHEGDKVAMWYVSANRDEERFTNPHELDIGRKPTHGAFGTGGPHYCLGAHLARIEIIGLFTELLRRLPDIAVTGKPERLRSNFVHGIKRLPVAFTPVGGPS